VRAWDGWPARCVRAWGVGGACVRAGWPAGSVGVESHSTPRCSIAHVYIYIYKGNGDRYHIGYCSMCLITK
jgi:hypothetical protein